ncbi:hypothetical protein [Priestia megaterium]|uniref:Uncharacterized protein n=1 Tax=Priestia megaterium TaxID=1404 RepID=A0A6M6EB86_PRIMG|nr:hypothetical protein [Priestia megaterium]QJX80795.1 hypothetical protein FDZ14_32410 [Priestia megaterium]
MKPLKKLGYVSIGMVITDINGVESTVTDIIIPSIKSRVNSVVIPKDNDLVLQLDSKQYLSTNIGWFNLDHRILVKNWRDFSPPVNH